MDTILLRFHFRLFSKKETSIKTQSLRPNFFSLPETTVSDVLYIQFLLHFREIF